MKPSLRRALAQVVMIWVFHFKSLVMVTLRKVVEVSLDIATNFCRWMLTAGGYLLWEMTISFTIQGEASRVDPVKHHPTVVHRHQYSTMYRPKYIGQCHPRT